LHSYKNESLFPATERALPNAGILMFFGIALITGAVMAPAVEKPHVNFDDLMTMQRVSDLQVSPSGR
jgi:hypothetical protein